MTTTKTKICSGIVLSFLLFSCAKLERPSGQANLESGSESLQQKSLNPREGLIYTMSNEEKGNSILSYLQHPNGTLSYQASTASGGNGKGAGLGSQGSVVVDAPHHLLFAVNAGSNTVSSFKISDNGGLTLVHTISSFGNEPVSVTIHGNTLYVVNSITSNISGYTVAADGSFNAINGSVQGLSSDNAGPAEIKFTPGGQKLVVTEKNNNKITTYSVNASGLAGSRSSSLSVGQTPFGFDFAGNTMVVTEASGGAPNASTVSSYNTSGMVLPGSPVSTKQTAACWAAASSDGRYAYVTNTGSNTISSFQVSTSGSLTLLNAVEVVTGTTPTDITFSDNDFYVYNINAGSHSITVFKKGGNPTLKKIGEVTGLPAHAVGIASY